MEQNQVSSLNISHSKINSNIIRMSPIGRVTVSVIYYLSCQVRKWLKS